MASASPGAAHEEEDVEQPVEAVPPAEEPAAEGDAEEEPAAGGDAQEPAPSRDAYETVVTTKRPMTAASSSTVRDRDFMLRPHPRPADILMVTPGLFVVQHAGGGKANQYFLRGFDADHGTDLALSVDGVPVNMVSHGHGQGYADMHWVIPEVVKRIDVAKGPYFAEHGDFATAGAINLTTYNHFEANSVSLTGGSFNTYRALLMATPHFDAFKPVLAAEVYGTDGPFDNPEHLKRYNVFTKLTRELAGGGTLSLAATSYAGGWRASGQIPLRAVRDGSLGRFGFIDPTEGGDSARHSVYATYHAADTDGEVSLTAYFVSYRLSLFSNFTFFARDPVNGDMIEQNDARNILGLKGSYRFVRRLGGVRFDGTFGVQARTDSIDNGLHYDVRRERLSNVVDTHVSETSIGVYGQEDIAWTPWLRSVIGLRADYFGFSVDDHLEDTATLGTRTSGVKQDAIASPKASVVISPLADWDIYLNFGMGFHSNDARGIVRSVDAVKPLTRAIGEEVGSRVRIGDRLDLAATFFYLHLDSEIVWVGDEGTTEPRGATRRYGFEGEARYRILPWLFADADITATRATYVENAGNGDAVALAPKLMVQGGLSARHPSGVFGRVGVFHIGDRPATEDGSLTAEGFTRFDATVGYRYKFVQVTAAVQNVLNTNWREAQFANASRLASESAPVEDLHFTPGAPVNAQGTVTLFF